MNNNTLKKILINALGISLVSAILLWSAKRLFFYSSESRINASEDFIVTIFVWIIVFIVVVIYQTLLTTLNGIDRNEKAIEKVNSLLAESMKSLTIQSHMNDILKYVNNAHGDNIGRPLLQLIVDDHINQITTDPLNKKFVVDGQSSSLLGYRIFWKIINEEQKKRNLNNEEPLKLRITHSNNPEIWNPQKSEIAKEMLELQSDFLAQGGKIIRFFIVNETVNQNGHNQLNDIINVHKNDYQIIHTYRVNVNRDNLAYDFLYMAEEQMITKWFSSPSGDGLAWMEINNSIPLRDNTLEAWKKYGKKLIKQEIEKGNKKIEDVLNSYMSDNNSIE